MKFKRLEVYNYPRINNSSKVGGLAFDITTPIMIILGSNGGGKSTLLELLTPYLVKSNMLASGGYINLFLEFNNKEYELRINEENGTHEFIVDNINLNESNLYTSYKALCEQHFLPQNIFNVLVGILPRDTLSGMSVGARKELLTTISKTDYNLLNNLFSKVKSKLNASKQILKHESSKLVDSDNKQISKDDITTLHNEITKLKDEVRLLDKDGYTLDNSLTVTQEELEEEARKINELYDEYLKLTQLLSKTHFELNLNDIIPDTITGQLLVEKVTTLKNDTNYTLNTISKLTDEINDLKDTIKRIVNNDTEKLKVSLLKEVTDCKESIAIYSKQITIPYDREIAVSRFDQLRNIQSRLLDITTHTPSSKVCDIPYSLSELQDKINRATQVVNNSPDYLKQLNRQKDDLKAMLEQHKVTCPECKHTFNSRHIDPSDVDKLDEQIQQVIVSEEKATKFLDYYSPVLEDYLKYTTNISNLHDVLSNLTNMDLFKKDIEKLIIDDNLSATQSVVHTHMDDYELHLKIFETELKMANIKVRIDAIEEASKENTVTSLDELRTKLLHLESDLKLQEDMLRANVYNSKLVNILNDQYNQLVSLHNEIADRRTKLIDLKDRVLNNNIATVIHNAIETKNNTINRLTLEANNLTNLLNRVNEIKSIIEEHKINIDRYSACHDLLSPNKGFIGYSIRSLLNKIALRINAHLANIWETPLELLELPEGKIVDYKIPLKVNNSSPTIISATNKGSTDIINFLFKLVIAEIMGIRDYPIYIDELGSSFDVVHKDKIFRYIDNVLSNQDRGTLFLVSHSPENYTMFDPNKVTYIVVDDVNIDTDELDGEVIIC